MPRPSSIPDQQPYAGGYSIPAPIGGLNARDALANMPETDAIICDNFFPQPTWVELRGGSTKLAGFAGNCETLAAYNGLVSNQLYAAVANGATRSLYRVDNAAGGTVTVPVVGGSGPTVQAISSTRYDAAQYGFGNVDVLWLVNGIDNPLLFDGTTWLAVTGVSVPYALTGFGSPNLLDGVVVYKQRLWFKQINSFNVYYLPQNSIAGALTKLDIGPNFKMGGNLQTMITVSIDNAAGLNDYIAFISDVGEVVVFSGYDPASVNTWSLAAHFRIGRPIGSGRRCWQKIGSDAAIITTDGLVLMSEALLTDRSQTKNAVSDKIRHAINDAVTTYGRNFGWQVQLYPLGSKLIVNVPTTEDVAGYQYVMNTLNNAWCTFGKYFSPWNAICFEVMGDNLYYGGAGIVCQADTLTFDDQGAAINAFVKPAFSYFGEKGKLKRWTMARPIFTVTGTLSVGLTLVTDFATSIPSGTVPVSTGNSAVWNVSLWSTPTYWGDAAIISKNWIGAGGLGYVGSLELQLASLDVSLQWQSTDFVFEVAGLL